MLEGEVHTNASFLYLTTVPTVTVNTLSLPHFMTKAELQIKFLLYIFGCLASDVPSRQTSPQLSYSLEVPMLNFLNLPAVC